ncbi:DNA repair protein [Bordetella hinzii]|nr:DNA repair protein [Bordetella hinzii]QWF45726.1 DNA repair protein [Bordetella hinzii]QWF50265.1 DNA repair protein [Bordetella hinzii]QWF54799.1 DNA repair protein [Bordetella hinzii]QWF59294.1 DNA repair protein [Bordetella hinzii]
MRAQLRTTTQQLQQLQSQQAQANAARAAAEAQRDTAQKEVQRLGALLEDTRRAQGALAERRASAEARLAAAHAQAGKQRAAYDELLALARAEGQAATRSLAERDSQLKACVGRNEALYAAGKEILSAYESFSTGDLLALRQPFSQQARVAFDEGAQALGDKLYDGRYQAGPAR